MIRAVSILNTLDPRCVHIIFERMPGVPELEYHCGLSGGLLDFQYMSSLIDSFADISIRISHLPFKAVGGLGIDTQDSIIVASDPEFIVPTLANRTGLGGPYPGFRARYTSVIDAICGLMRKGLMFRQHLTLAYLSYLEIRRLITNYHPMGALDTEFFLEHPDPHSGNLLLQGSSISAYIDWQW